MKHPNVTVTTLRLRASIWALLTVSSALQSVGVLCAVAPQDAKAAGFEEVVSHYERCGYFQGVVLIAQHGQVVCAKGAPRQNL